MILLNKDEIIRVLLAKYPGFDPEMDINFEATEVTNKAQLKKTLINTGKQVQRMDGSFYLVPDYHKYRQALIEAGLED